MINLKTERLFSLRAATRQIGLLKGRGRNGGAVNFVTIWRWSQLGMRGVRLETVRAGGTLCTTEAAVRRFFEALTATDVSGIGPVAAA